MTNEYDGAVHGLSGRIMELVLQHLSALDAALAKHGVSPAERAADQRDQIGRLIQTPDVQDKRA